MRKLDKTNDSSEITTETNQEFETKPLINNKLVPPHYSKPTKL